MVIVKRLFKLKLCSCEKSYWCLKLINNIPLRTYTYNLLPTKQFTLQTTVQAIQNTGYNLQDLTVFMIGGILFLLMLKLTW